MINVISKRCVSCNLFFSTKEYDYYCYSCYCWKFPGSQPAKRHLIKERAVHTLMKASFPALEISYNKSVGCSQRRPDWFIDCLTHCIFVECDEEQHKSYKKLCEYVRLLEILEDISYRPLVVLRFNPDKYKNSDGDIIEGCFPNKAIKPTVKLGTRFEELRKAIEYHRQNIPIQTLIEEKFFFDGK